MVRKNAAKLAMLPVLATGALLLNPDTVQATENNAAVTGLQSKSNVSGDLEKNGSLNLTALDRSPANIDDYSANYSELDSNRVFRQLKPAQRTSIESAILEHYLDAKKIAEVAIRLQMQYGIPYQLQQGSEVLVPFRSGPGEYDITHVAFFAKPNENLSQLLQRAIRYKESRIRYVNGISGNYIMAGQAVRLEGLYDRQALNAASSRAPVHTQSSIENNISNLAPLPNLENNIALDRMLGQYPKYSEGLNGGAKDEAQPAANQDVYFSPTENPLKSDPQNGTASRDRAITYSSEEITSRPIEDHNKTKETPSAKGSIDDIANSMPPPQPGDFVHPSSLPGKKTEYIPNNSPAANNNETGTKEIEPEDSIITYKNANASPQQADHLPYKSKQVLIYGTDVQRIKKELLRLYYQERHQEMNQWLQEQMKSLPKSDEKMPPAPPQPYIEKPPKQLELF